MTEPMHQNFDEIQIPIEDLVLEDPAVIQIQQITADRNLAFNIINEAIMETETKKWSIEEMADGKEIDVFDEWKGSFINQIVFEYRMAGWNVLHFIHGKREYLSFYHPDRKNLYNPQISVPPSSNVGATI